MSSRVAATAALLTAIAAATTAYVGLARFWADEAPEQPARESTVIREPCASYSGNDAERAWIASHLDASAPPATIDTRPLYPKDAGDRGLEGRVQTRFKVEGGRAVRIETDGGSSTFDRAVREALAQRRWPERASGLACEVWIFRLAP
jgi:hypothetical protein